MKAASGELNLTVITIIAIAAVLGFFMFFFNGTIKDTISEQWGKVSGNDGYSEGNADATGSGS